MANPPEKPTVFFLWLHSCHFFGWNFIYQTNNYQKSRHHGSMQYHPFCLKKSLFFSVLRTRRFWLATGKSTRFSTVKSEGLLKFAVVATDIKTKKNNKNTICYTTRKPKNTADVIFNGLTKKGKSKPETSQIFP